MNSPDFPTTVKIFPGVELAGDSEIGEFVVLGQPPRGKRPGELLTVIGDKAIIRSHTVIYAGNRIGSGFQTGHAALVREENDIGDDVSIGSHTVVEHHVKIGKGVRIHSQAFVPEFTVLEDGCWIGPRAVLTNARYPLAVGVKENLKGPLVKRRAKIGANSTILPGLVIGEDALVGAGAVVVHDVPAGAIVVGCPAKLVGSVWDLGVYGPKPRIG